MSLMKKSIGKLDQAKTKDLGNGVVDVVVSSEIKDRHGEILDIKGLNIKEYSGVVFLNHDYNSFPIGKSIKLSKTRDGKLLSRTQFAIDEYEVAKTAYALVKGGYMPDVSIGFIPIDWDEETSTWTKADMIEYSHVGIGANPDAKVTGKMLEKVGVTQDEFKQQLNDPKLKSKALKIKGAVANVLEQGDKYEEMEDFWEVVYAFCDAYMSYDSGVDDFEPLLQECIDILQTIVNGTYAYEDEDENPSDSPGDEVEIMPVGMRIHKIDKDKVMKLLSIFTDTKPPKYGKKIDKAPSGSDNALKYIELAKTALSDTEEQLKTIPSDTDSNKKTKTIQKKIILTRAKRSLNSVDRIVELATSGLKEELKDK